MIAYELTNTTNHPIDTAVIESALARAEVRLGDIGDKTVTIEVVSPEESAEANAALRQKNEPTDIISVPTEPRDTGEQEIISNDGALSFTLKPDKPVGESWPVVGQLILCYDVIADNAKRAGQPVERELEWVIEHGMYHVMGFHHEHDS